MDGNKDEALKCLKIGREAFETGDRIRALKFITKARRLDPNLPVDGLLSAIEGESGDRPAENCGDVGTESPAANSSKPGVRNRVPANGSSSSSSSTAYTEEQVLIVREIKKKKDYYEVLGLERGCSVEDVRKGYRKLSLKVHPDKNKAPGAEEAFKAVSKAFQCLSDEESRKRYDLVGSEEPVYERRPARRAQQGFNGFYDDVDAEEIFRNFFFGGMPQATTQFRGFQFGTGMGHRTGDQGSDGFNVRALIQLLPILLIILLQFLPSSEPIYSLSRSYQYQHQFTTQRGVNYYTKTAKYEQEYPFDSPERMALEVKIEREYVSIITQNCRVEVQRRQWGFIQETPYCDMLERFHQAT